MNRIDDYRLARANYVGIHKSAHWDIFADDYESVIANAGLWKDFRRNGITVKMDSGAVSEAAARRGKVKSLAERCGMDFIRKHHENSVGNPNAVDVDGMRITVSDLRLVHDAWRISGLVENPSLIVEIGGGYGGLAAKLKQLFPKATIVLFDLPEANAIQHYYLSVLYPAASIAGFSMFMERGWKLLDDGYDFVLLPGWTAAEMPAGVDLAVNTRSMMEMNKGVVSGYMAAINRTVRPDGIFYCVNRYAKWTVGENIRIKDYQLGRNWYLTINGPAWDQPWIHEFAAVRTVKPNAQALLSGLPPYDAAGLRASLRQAAHALVALTWGGHHNVNPGLKGTIRAVYRAALRKAASIKRTAAG